MKTLKTDAKTETGNLILPNLVPASAFPPGGRDGAKFILLSDLRGWNAAMSALYTLKSP